MAAGRDDQQAPLAMAAHHLDELLVWSSLWAAHPAAQIRLELAQRADDSGTDLTWTLLLAEPADGAEEVTALRERLNRLINADLRATFDQ